MITEFEEGIATPLDIVAAPDGAMWFTNAGSHSIGRITPDGQLTFFSDAAVPSGWGIVLGPDGALWFAGSNGTIGRITTAGAMSSFPVGAGIQPFDVTTGPDGAIWFTSHGVRAVGRIAVDGSVTVFPVAGTGVLGGIAPGPDGALWFTDQSNKQVHRLTTVGVDTVFASPIDGSFIAAGPDGAMWFTTNGPNIGRASMDGTVTALNYGSSPGSSHAIVAGPDGAMWFTDSFGGVRRVTTGGEFTMPVSYDNPTGIGFGPDGTLWITDTAPDAIVRVTDDGSITRFPGTGVNEPQQLVRADDGALWFRNTGGGPSSVGRFVTTGTLDIFELSGWVSSIARGPTGGLWFTEPYSEEIGLISKTGAVQRFSDPAIGQVWSVAPGADGAVWLAGVNGLRLMTAEGTLTDPTGGTVTSADEVFAGANGEMWFKGPAPLGRITGDGTITLFTDPTLVAITDMTPGPDGATWFTRAGATPAIGRIGPDGVINLFVDSAIGSSRGIAGGPDGALWFTNNQMNSIGRITTSGAVAAYPSPAVRGPWGIAAGPDGDMWFANRDGSSIGRISTSSTPAPGRSFHPIAPTRILDSRGPLGGWNGRVTAGTPRSLVVSPSSGAGVPADADAVVLNVTVTGSTHPSFLSVYPAGEPPPDASSLNFSGGQTVANLVTVKTGAGGAVEVATAVGAVHVVADIVGYYSAASGDGFHPLPPARILDSRGPNGGWSSKLGSNPRKLEVRGRGGVPAWATAVIANVTVTDASANSFLTVYPSGPVPTVSNLNFAAQQTIPNLVTVRIGDDGSIMVANNAGATHVIVDVVGYFTTNSGSLFRALAPTRLLDSRTPTGMWPGKLASGSPRTVTVAGTPSVPPWATAVVGNATVTEGTDNSFLTLYPAGGSTPVASNVNFAAGETTANAAVVQVGGAGRIEFANAVGATHVVYDAVGYFAP